MKRIFNRRYLRPLIFGRKSKIFYVFDIETGIVEKDGTIKYFLSARPEHFIFGVVYGSDGYIKVIDTVADFIKEFKKKRYRNKIVYAHNAEYDLSGIFGNIYLLDPEAVFNGKFIACGNGVCRFADSFNLLPASVQKLGELLGLPKMDLGKTVRGFVKEIGRVIEYKLSSVRELVNDVRYCVRDCEIVKISLAKLFDNAEPSYTIGALSLKIFRNKFLEHTIKVDENADLFFDATYGGRTEAFRIGKTRAYVRDINSAYPFVMFENEFPDVARLRVLDTKDIKSAVEVMNTYEGMIYATVRVSPDEKFPSLPYRQPERLIFPCGTFTGAWTFPELKHALKYTKTEITAVTRLVFAPAIPSPFKKFIEFYWNERSKTNDEAERYFYKLFMNNLYGKMLQRAHEEYRFCVSDKDAFNFMRAKKIRKAELIEVVGGYFLRWESRRIFNHTIAPWGSYVTAYVRNMLHTEIVRHGAHAIYCDTDSIFTTMHDKSTSKELGGWKLEDKIITNVRTLKDYVYIDEKGAEKQALKGVKKNAKQLDEYANVFEFDRMIRTRESFRRTDMLPPGTFVQQIKTLSGDYLKREVMPNGTTKPFIL